MSRQLSVAGHQMVDNAEDAETCVLVTCTVIGSTEKRMLRRMAQLASAGRSLIVGGCMASAQAETVRGAVPSAELVAPTNAERFLRLLPPTGGEGYECFEPSSSIDGVVPIAQGCLARCAYCISTIARGPLTSYPPEDIASEVAEAVRRGRREIRLTSLDTGQYGRDLGINLATLLRAVCHVDGEFMVRVGMMSPMMLRPITSDLLQAYQEEKVFNFLHLPVQSGNDTILKRMRRGYRVDQFWEVVGAFRRKVRPLSLATDVIVGFPGEGEVEFEDTLDLIRELKPDILNITRFSPRPGTPAASMGDQVPGWIMKQRSRELTKLRFEMSQRANRKFVGRRLRVLTTEEGKNGTTIARSQDYRPVVLPGRHALGKFVEVSVTAAREIYLLGRPQAESGRDMALGQLPLPLIG